MIEIEPYRQLEEELAEWSSVKHMVACSSGTAALHLALEAMQFPPLSKVLVPDYTMIACARAVTLAGLRPVFVDCDDKLLMDRSHVESLLRGDRDKSIKCLMLVHVYGRRCDVESFPHREGMLVIEDMAEVHGVKPHKDTDAACWSFYKNKIVHGEEGGAVGFRDPKHAHLARQLRSLGFTEAHDFQHVPRGHNYRMSNVHAELILYSLRSQGIPWTMPDGRFIPSLDHERRRIEGLYDLFCPYAAWKMPPRDSPWVYDFRIPGLTREKQDEIVRELNADGIAARHGFKPMSCQAEYDDGSGSVWNPRAVAAGREVIYLPLAPFRSEAFMIVQRTLGAR